VLGRAESAKRFYEILLGTQWAAPAQLKAYQDRLLTGLLAHAANSEFYRETLTPLLRKGDALREEDWRRLPTFDRKVLAARFDAIRVPSLPSLHGNVRLTMSGGSTGTPLNLALSDIESLARVVATFRMFTAYGFDLSQPLIMIRPAQFGSGRTDRLAFRRWGFPWENESELGLRIHLDIRSPTDEQFSAIRTAAPVYINTLPSNLLRLGLEARRRDEHPSVPFVISVAEYLAPEVRRLTQQSFGSTVIDILSSAEAGIIAIQCPESGKYHIQSEIVLAEILDADGNPCGPGEVGELVVTPLYNYATPLIRYRSGDFAIAGLPCPCGRTLPTLKRIEGRREHRFVFPDGTRRLPSIDRVRISELLGHDEWQLVQTSADATVLRFAGDEPSRQALDEIFDLVRQAIGEGSTVEARSGTEVPLTSSGKRHHVVNQMAVN
jgi:phenylacetate-CoA ligase